MFRSALVNEALRRGVPVLTPETAWAVGLARHYGSVILYRTYLEALASLACVIFGPNVANGIFLARSPGRRRRHCSGSGRSV